MNRFMQEQWPMFAGTHTMRDEMLDTLSEADLNYSPGGQNVPFGQLWREMGEVEHAYVESFKTFKQDFSWRNPEAGLEGSVSQLKSWFATLDAELEAVLGAMSDEDFKKTVERSGFAMPMEWQVQAYLQALLIFFGKATIYLKTMNKPLTKKIEEWIG